MAESPIPKLFINAEPGSILTGAARDFCRNWPNQKEITVKGTVTEYNWGNPHVMMGLDVSDEAGNIEKWSVGGPSITRMAGNGWDKNTLKVGDVITGTGYRFADGQRILRLQRVVMPDGKVMQLYGR